MSIDEQLDKFHKIHYTDWRDMVRDIIDAGGEYYMSYYGREFGKAFRWSKNGTYVVNDTTDGWYLYRGLIVSEQDAFVERSLLP